MFAALLAICAWISIPVADIAFTMQTFGVFLVLEVLGGKWGTAAIGVYLLLGTVGMPVFSGFQGGIGTLLGVTGGYLWGFLATGLIYWALEKRCNCLAPIAGLLGCYLCGSFWFSIYAGSAGFWAGAMKCVIPYLLPDLAKLSLAKLLGKRLRARKIL